tara:strand:- start:2931 stop:3113 length:183 start_codon:yes stop_codon:yes gene_type:complete
MDRKLFDAFQEVYEKNLKPFNSRTDTFNKAQEQFEKQYGVRGYKNIESFKSARSQRKRKP